jgi:hypothetical protein
MSGSEFQELWRAFNGLQEELEKLREKVEKLEAGAEESALSKHRKRHVMLHQNLDELTADFFAHVRGSRPITTTLVELMQWSHQQTKEPED